MTSLYSKGKATALLNERYRFNNSFPIFLIEVPGLLVCMTQIASVILKNWKGATPCPALLPQPVCLGRTFPFACYVAVTACVQHLALYTAC